MQTLVPSRILTNFPSIRKTTISKRKNQLSVLKSKKRVSSRKKNLSKVYKKKRTSTKLPVKKTFLKNNKSTKPKLITDYFDIRKTPDL